MTNKNREKDQEERRQNPTGVVRTRKTKAERKRLVGDLIKGLQ